MINKYKSLLFLLCIFISISVCSKNITFYSANISISAKVYGPANIDFTDYGPAIFNITDSFFCYKLINNPQVHIFAISETDTNETQIIYTAHNKDKTVKVSYEPQKAKFCIDFTDTTLIMDGYFSSIPLEHAEYVKAMKLKGVNTDSLYRNLRTLDTTYLKTEK